MADYIKRSDAMTICERYSQHCFETSDSKGQDIADRILDDIAEMNTADVVEVKHGEWKIKTDNYDCEYMMCSCCKEEFYPAEADTVDTTPNYCMNCGAKMDLKEGAHK